VSRNNLVCSGRPRPIEGRGLSFCTWKSDPHGELMGEPDARERFCSSRGEGVGPLFPRVVQTWWRVPSGIKGLLKK